MDIHTPVPPQPTLKDTHERKRCRPAIPAQNQEPHEHTSQRSLRRLSHHHVFCLPRTSLGLIHYTGPYRHHVHSNTQRGKHTCLVLHRGGQHKKKQNLYPGPVWKQQPSASSFGPFMALQVLRPAKRAGGQAGPSTHRYGAVKHSGRGSRHEALSTMRGAITGHLSRCRRRTEGTCERGTTLEVPSSSRRVPINAARNRILREVEIPSGCALFEPTRTV